MWGSLEYFTSEWEKRPTRSIQLHDPEIYSSFKSQPILLLNLNNVLVPSKQWIPFLGGQDLDPEKSAGPDPQHWYEDDVLFFFLKAVLIFYAPIPGGHYFYPTTAASFP